MGSEKKSPFNSLSALQGVMRHLDAIQAMYPKGVLQQFEQSTLPYANVGAFEVLKSVESLTGLTGRDAFVGSMVALRDMHELMGAMKLVGLHSSWAEHTKAWDRSAAAGLCAGAGLPTFTLALHERLAHTGALQFVDELAYSFGAPLPDGFAATLQNFRSADDLSRRASPAASADAFGRYLASSLVPTVLGLGAASFKSPTAIFSLLDGAAPAGTLAWLRPSELEGEEPTVEVATWAAQPEGDDVSDPTEGEAQSTTIHLVTNLKCLLCGEPILAQHEQIKATSKTTIVQMISVVPVCPTCNERARKDPTYFLRHFEASFDRPRLWLVKGGAEGDGAPVGQLRIVKTDGDED